MIFVLDTNAFSDLIRQHARVTARLGNVAALDQVIICPIVRGEIRYGIERLPLGKKRTELEVSAGELFKIIPCESLPEAAGDHYAVVKKDLIQIGAALSENDIWIASFVLAGQGLLVTRDGDFHQVDGLAVEDWTV